MIEIKKELSFFQLSGSEEQRVTTVLMHGRNSGGKFYYYLFFNNKALCIFIQSLSLSMFQLYVLVRVIFRYSVYNTHQMVLTLVEKKKRGKRIIMNIFHTK